MTFLSVVKWRDYQHHHTGDREMVWTKWYVKTLDKKKVQRLSFTARALWPYVLLLAARYDNAILNDSNCVAKELYLPEKLVREGLDELLKKRLLQETLTPRRASLEKGGTASKKLTGWKYARGSHGGTFLRDEAGTDRPPRAFLDSIKKERAA